MYGKGVTPFLGLGLLASFPDVFVLGSSLAVSPTRSPGARCGRCPMTSNRGLKPGWMKKLVAECWALQSRRPHGVGG